MRRHRVLVLVVTAVALVVVAPTLARVYRETSDAFALSPWWLAAIGVAVAVQLLANIELNRIMLRAPSAVDVGAPMLAGNAVSHLVPGGNAIGAGVQIRMLTRAGFPLTRILTTMGAVTMIGAVSGFVVLPLMVLVASAVGSDVDADLVVVMWIGAAALFAVLVALVAIARRDGSWDVIARAVVRVQRLVRREGEAGELAQRLRSERDQVTATLRGRMVYVLAIDLGRTVGDYLALYFALHATGAPVSAAAAMAAFIVSNLAGMIPLTPGGLGFVEAGLAGVLMVAGASDAQADLTVATYRLAATWLPCILGLVAFLVFERRHAHRQARITP